MTSAEQTYQLFTRGSHNRHVGGTVGLHSLPGVKIGYMGMDHTAVINLFALLI